MPSRRTESVAVVTSHWTPVGSVRVHARAWTAAAGAESRPTIVLVHGLGVSSRYMVPTGEALAPSFRVFAPDLPGFGRSQAPRRPYTIAQHAATLAAWMHDRGITRPVLAGNSYGCQVIAELMIQQPSCAAGIVLSAPTVESTRRSAVGESLRLLSDAPLERFALVPVVIGDYLRAGPRTILFTLRDAIADRIEDKLPNVAVPAIIVRGARDPIVSQAWVDRLAAGMPRGRVITLDGAPHAVNYSSADRFAEIVAGLAVEITGPGRPT